MRLLNMPKKTMAEKNVKILGIVISAFLIICSLGFVGNIIYEINSLTVVNNIIYYVVDIVAQGMLLTAFVFLAVSILSKNKLKIDIIKVFAGLFLIANILYLSNGLYQSVVIFGADILSVFGTVFSKPLYYLFAASKIAIAAAILFFNKRNMLAPENKKAKCILLILFAISFCLYCFFEIGKFGLTSSLTSFMTFITSSDNSAGGLFNGIFISFFLNIIFMLAEYIPLFLFFVIYPKGNFDKKTVGLNLDNAKSEI